MYRKSFLKVLSVLLIMLMLMFMVELIGVAANEKTIVYADEIICDTDEVLIPIKIDNNNGIAGIGLTFTYDSNIFTPIEVIRSDNFDEGMLNDSISTAQENSFDVIWSGVENYYGEGEIFILRFMVNNTETTSSEIKISYNKNNSFDEEINEIEIDCENIIVKFDTNSGSSFNFVVWLKNIIDIIVNMIKSLI